jgi:hypothetical protein
LWRENARVAVAVLLAVLLFTGAAAEARDAASSSVAVRVATVAGGNILIDGKPFFMIASWAQCAADVDRNLALGINTFVTSLCDEGELASRVDGRGYVIGSLGGNDSLPGSIGYVQPDEPDVHGIPAAELAPPPGNGKLTLLNLSMNFWSGSRSTLDYGPLFKRADVLSTSVYPVELNCNRAPWVTFETVYDVQRELAAVGPPSGQWLEANAIDRTCSNVLSPAMVQAEAWLAVEGGASWIGWFFPEATGEGYYRSFSVTPAIADAIRTVNAQLERMAPVLLAPRLDVATPWGNGLASGPDSNPIKVGGRSYDGRYYLFATNSTNADVSWRRALPNLARNDPVTVEGGATLIAAASGLVVDAFKPFETKIYSWVPKMTAAGSSRIVQPPKAKTAPKKRPAKKPKKLRAATR